MPRQYTDTVVYYNYNLYCDRIDDAVFVNIVKEIKDKWVLKVSVVSRSKLK